MFKIKHPFGVELEFSDGQISRSDLDRTCREVFQEFNQPYTNREVPDKWTLKDDPSCGHELTTPRLVGEQGIDLLQNVLVAIQARHKGQNLVDTRCGLHVHLDMGDLTRNQLFQVTKAFARVEGLLFRLVPTSRREGNYCHPISRYHNGTNDFGHIPMDHYEGTNFCRWMDRGTMEVRYAGGSCNAKKIGAWVRLLQGIVNRTVTHGMPERCLEDFNQFWAWMGEPQDEIDQKVKAWVDERDQFFRENGPEANRRRYLEAKQIRDRIENVAHRQYHNFLRRGMESREQRRAHDQEILSRHAAGTLLEWSIPEDWLNHFYEEHPEHRPEGAAPSPLIERAIPVADEALFDDEIPDEDMEDEYEEEPEYAENE